MLNYATQINIAMPVINLVFSTLYPPLELTLLPAFSSRC